MKKPALLFLAHRIPYPPNKGDKIRSFNLLKSLARDYRIHLGAFVDDKEDWQYEAELRKYCAEVFLLGIQNAQKYRTVTAFFKNEALSLPYYRQTRLKKWVDNKVQHEQISRVFVYSSAMAQYVQGEMYKNMHRIIDFVDVDSEKWREYSLRRSWPMNWLYKREANRMLHFDRAIANEFDASVFVSAHEADVFKTLAPESKPHIFFINNGVDAHYFSSEEHFANPYPEQTQVIVFTGAMDYWANVDAVSWFAEKVFPEIRHKFPHAWFYIVGARPSEKVKKLANQQNIHVTGSVKDIRPYLAYASIAVAPMRIARGVQNKVLEAMAMSKPVVATSAAMEGIPTLMDQPVCDDEKAFSSACLRLLEEGDITELGMKGRAQILQEFNWDQNLVKLEALLGDRTANPGNKLQGVVGLNQTRGVREVL
ncbi:MAG: TIGR03087 family PEP-CTERM/XrtA system glycosyltransferase [Pseudomonadales bacterium]|nr:TIGR03087 family PEP-CTERM/XrtA system glycosyltransferase [Pseudomonadales bacterium]